MAPHKPAPRTPPGLEPAETGRLAAALGITLAMGIFAGNFVGVRHGLLAGIGRFDFVALRYGVAGLVFLPALLKAGIVRLAGVGWRRGVILTALGGAPYFFLAVLGLSFAPASHAVVLNPGLTTLAAQFFAWRLVGRKPPAGSLAGIAAIVAGLLAIGWEGLALSGPKVWVGDLILAVSGANWGLFAVLLQRWRVRALDATAIISVLSLPLVAGWVFLAGTALDRAPLAEVVLQAAYQGLLAGGLGILLFNRAVVVLGSAAAALFPPLVPVFGTILAAVWLNEAITPPRALGIALVIGGMIVAGRFSGQRRSGTGQRR